MQNNAGEAKALATLGFPLLAIEPHTPSLSDVASQHLKGRKPLRKESWRGTHIVDAVMREKFEIAAHQITERNRPLNRNSFKPNAMLTLNTGALARSGETPQQTLRRMMQNMRNLYRGRAHRFASVWRFEIGLDYFGGPHHHIVFHSPRGMRSELMEALPGWTGEALDASRSSQIFNRSRWLIYSLYNTWQLERVYDVPGILDYLAKVRVGRNGEPSTRAVRLTKATGRVREYGASGLDQ